MNALMITVTCNKIFCVKIVFLHLKNYSIILQFPVFQWTNHNTQNPGNHSEHQTMWLKVCNLTVESTGRNLPTIQSSVFNSTCSGTPSNFCFLNIRYHPKVVCYT